MIIFIKVFSRTSFYTCLFVFKIVRLEGTSKTRFSSKALKKLNDVLRRMRDSLVDIAEAGNLFKYDSV